MDIHIHNLTRTFGSLRANDAITLSFAAGKIHGILGENGAGKSTLMKMLSGFLRRDSGDVLLDGQPVPLDSPANALNAGIGMVYQEPLDVPAFTALENFVLACPRHIMQSKTAMRQRLNELCSQFDFSVDPASRVSRLTMGQRQQLEIMRLLAWGARVLILDEPTTGITAAQKTALFAALRLLAREGKTILFVSHKLEEVDELCDTASVLRAGKVMGTGVMEMPQPHDHLLNLMFGQTIPTTLMSTTPEQAFYPSLPYPVWQLDNITLREGILTLANLHLTIRAGMVLGLAGLDGSGQQLVLRLLAGLKLPIAGKILLNGKDYTRQSLATFQADGVHYLPADRMADGLIGAFSLTEHIALYNPTSFLLKPRKVAQQTAQHAIREYDIRATPHTPMEDLSGGNQQRAMLSLLPPRCTGLLLEQPTRGLDITSASGVWNRLQTRCADGMALVFTSADLDELLQYSDDVVVFFSGRVSRPLPRSSLSTTRLAELIGGVGFAAVQQNLPKQTKQTEQTEEV